jgi:6-phosphogluconolactonase
MYFARLLVPRSVVLLAVSLFAATVLSVGVANDTKADKYWLYVGTYTGKDSKGIYRFDFDAANGKLTNRALAGETVNPSFLAIHPSQQFLYAVGEMDKFKDKKGGAVSAFALDPKTGDLKLLNQESSGGSGPCFVTVDKQGKNVLVANYGGGNASSLPIKEDGSLGAATGFVQHKGDNPKQQPLAHSVNLDAANRFAFVADAGLDKVFVYKFDPAKGTLTANDPPAVEIGPKTAPRHFAFHPDGKHAYAINERLSSVTTLDYDADKGILKPIQTIPTLPKDFAGNNSTAEVVVHSSGKFLYGSNRGHDSIAIFTIDPKTRQLTSAGHQGTKIKTPRNFVIDPTGNYLLVGNQGANSIVVFQIDPETGQLKPTETLVEVGTPVCLRFVPVKR